MTQPVQPGFVPLGQLAPLAGVGVAPAAPGVAGQAPVPPPSTIEQMLAQARAENAAIDEELARKKQLEEEHGKLGVIGAQFARGALDAVMAPAALGSMVIEGAGAVTGAEWMEEFGRDLGTSASGRELMGAYMATQGVLAGDGKEAISEYERTKRNLAEQEEAWPLLSTVSHLGGAVTVGLATGGLSSGAHGLAATVGAGAFEGAAGGAQMAYAKNASLRDVASSALLGAAMSGGLTYGIGKGAQYLQGRAEHAAMLREALGDADDVARRAGVTVEEAGGREAQSVIGDLEKYRKAAVEAADSASTNPTVRGQALASALEESSEALAKKAGKFEPDAWLQRPPSPLQKVLYRKQILDKASDDVAETVARVAERRPGLDVSLDVKRIAKLMKRGQKGLFDGPSEGIGTIQSRVGQLMAELPKSVDGDALRFTLRDASSRLMKLELPEAMREGHELVKLLGKAASTAGDDTTRAFAERGARSLADDLTGEAFGDAGKLYAQLVADPSSTFAALGQREIARDALRTLGGRGTLPDVIRAEANAIAAANDAAAKLTGQAAPKGLAAELRSAEALMAKAEEAVTLDGGPVGRVFDWFKNKAEGKAAGYIGGQFGTAVGGMIGGWPGAMAGNIVASAVQKRIGSLMGALKGIGGGHVPHVPHIAKHFAIDALKEEGRVKAVKGYLSTSTKHASLSAEDRHKQDGARRDALEQLASAEDHPETVEGIKAIDSMAPGLGSIAAGDMQEKLAMLRADLIKPRSDIRGKAFEVMSAEDLRKNNAMWEATVDPMSVYSDLAAGSLDYDKLSYTWKQYPGLLTASQMGLADIVHSQLNDEERANIPEHVLGQLDLAFQMNGSLTRSLDRGMSKRIDQANQMLAQQTQQQGGPRSMLRLPGAKPTMTQRIGGNA